MDTVYYIGRIQTEIAYGIMCMGQIIQVVLSKWRWGSPHFFQKQAHDNTHGALPTSPAHLSLGALSFYRDLVTELWLTAWVAGLIFQHLQRLSLIPCGPKPSPWIHCLHGQSGVANVHRQTMILFSGRTCQGLRDSLPGIESKGPTSLWICFLYSLILWGTS